MWPVKFSPFSKKAFLLQVFLGNALLLSSRPSRRGKRRIGSEAPRSSSILVREMSSGYEEAPAKATDDPDTTEGARSDILPRVIEGAFNRIDGRRIAAAKAWAVSTCLKCLICCERQREWRSLWKHMRLHNPTPEHPEIFQDCRLPNGFFQCLVCGHQARQMRQLRRHYYCHATERPFECNICQKRYKTTEVLLVHLTRTHGRESTTYKCDKCKYCTARKHLLPQHIWKVHSGAERCEVCFKEIRKIKIKEHYFPHTGETRFACEICGEKFIYHHTLKSHTRKRHMKQAHECKVCGKILKSSNGPVQHVKRSHTKEPSHMYCICSKPFYSNSDYVDHVAKVHVGEGERKCAVCGKGFFCKSGLRNYALLHMERIPFACDVCGKGFAFKSLVNDHMKTHSEERPFKCDLCGGALKWKRNVAIHVRTKHA